MKEEEITIRKRLMFDEWHDFWLFWCKHYTLEMNDALTIYLEKYKDEKENKKN